MCAIAGIADFGMNLVAYNGFTRLLVRDMAEAMYSRGPDSWGEWVGEHSAFSHSRLAVIDPDGGKQPMKRICEGYEFVITYNGELYNTDELRKDLISHGYELTSNSDTEVLLYTYIHYGDSCCERLEGIFAFAIWDSMRQRVFLCRDKFGVKPLFYTVKDKRLIFASEIKGLFRHPGVTPEINSESLCELFALSPARTPGCGVFKDVYELRPGYCMAVNADGMYEHCYWRLESKEHTDSYEETVEKVRFLVTDAIKRQLVSDVPIGTLLSGGLDSSLITAVAANHMKENGRSLSTYSFDYEDNDKYFKPSSFQPDSDAPWVERMVEEFATDHTRLVCPTEVLWSFLDDCVNSKDLPGMADVDCSLMYFCREIKKRHTVILSGECSDEIFGGYPWFRSKEAFERAAFPWCYDLTLRNSTLLPEVSETLRLEEYSRMRYEETLLQTPRFEYDSPIEARRREISYLNIVWFMSNLLDRKDRMSMASGLEVRVPFCDSRLVSYVWNIPWDMKCRNDVSKSLLREAACGILPPDVLARKKSPYPKTHNPAYERMVKLLLRDVISDPNAPLLAFCDNKVLTNLTDGASSDYGKPFFGQLMAGPQFLGYLLQVNYWLEHFKPRIV